MAAKVKQLKELREKMKVVLESFRNDKRFVQPLLPSSIFEAFLLLRCSFRYPVSFIVCEF